MDKKQIITLALAVLATANMILTASGHSVLPISDEQITLIISCVADIVMTALTIWRNFNFTKAAQQGQMVTDAIKDGYSVEVTAKDGDVIE